MLTPRRFAPPVRIATQLLAVVKKLDEETEQENKPK
jgi:hypothetical protein